MTAAPLHHDGAAPVARQRLRVIVAEDDPEMRRLVVESLRRDGHWVAELEHGGQVLALFGLETPGLAADVADLLVSDVRMPHVDGLTLMAVLRAAGWERPVVLMTAFGDDTTHARAKTLGAWTLDKPFALHDLRQLVRFAARVSAQRA